jgi:hypothetical protein
MLNYVPKDINENQAAQTGFSLLSYNISLFAGEKFPVRQAR